MSVFAVDLANQPGGLARRAAARCPSGPSSGTTRTQLLELHDDRLRRPSSSMHRHDGSRCGMESGPLEPLVHARREEFRGLATRDIELREEEAEPLAAGVDGRRQGNRDKRPEPGLVRRDPQRR